MKVALKGWWLGRGRFARAHLWTVFHDDGLTPLEALCGERNEELSDGWYAQHVQMRCKVCRVAEQLRS